MEEGREGENGGLMRKRELGMNENKEREKENKKMAQGRGNGVRKGKIMGE